MASSGQYSVIYINNLHSKLIIFVHWRQLLEHGTHDTNKTTQTILEFLGQPKDVLLISADSACLL